MANADEIDIKEMIKESTDLGIELNNVVNCITERNKKIVANNRIIDNLSAANDNLSAANDNLSAANEKFVKQNSVLTEQNIVIKSERDGLNVDVIDLKKKIALNAENIKLFNDLKISLSANRLLANQLIKECVEEVPKSDGRKRTKSKSKNITKSRKRKKTKSKSRKKKKSIKK